PLGDRLGNVEPLVELQTHERPPERLGGGAREVGLSDARRSFDEKRSIETKGEPEREHRRRIGEVARPAERALELGGTCRRSKWRRRECRTGCGPSARGSRLRNGWLRARCGEWRRWRRRCDGGRVENGRRRR